MTEMNKPPEEESPPATEPETQVATTAPTAPAERAIAPGALFGKKPSTFDEAWRFAQMMANSTMVPKDFIGKPQNVMVAMQMGMEIGLAPLASVQNIAVINGRPTLWGDALVAVCQSHRDFMKMAEWFEGEGETLTAYCRVWRRGYEPHTQSFSKTDAVTAGLWGKQGPWTNYPKRMLQNRARAFTLRDRFPDALRGVGSAEEQRDVIDISAGEYEVSGVGFNQEPGPTVHDSAATITAGLDAAEQEQVAPTETVSEGAPAPEPQASEPATAKKAPGRPTNKQKYADELKEADDVMGWWEDNKAKYQSTLSPGDFKALEEYAQGLNADRKMDQPQ